MRQWAGLPARLPRAVPVLLVLAVVLGAVAGAVADRFVSPAQIAARSAPPPPTLITARVRSGTLPDVTQLQATASAGNVVPVSAPGDLGGSLPVVTAVKVAAGQTVGPGQLLVCVAQQPVFVFAGVIPAFRAIQPGMTGPDIAELQAGLAAAGYGSGSDPSGVYGPGTAAAILALFKANGVTPVMSSPAGRAAAGEPAAPPRPPAGPVLQLGEVALVPALPARVASVAGLGATAGSSVAQLVTGSANLTAAVTPAQAGTLRPGLAGIAVSESSGAEFPVRLEAVRGGNAVFAPTGPLPAGAAGGTIQVTVTTSQARGLIVPIAAVSTGASGTTSVTVRTRGGTVRVPVRLGLASDGEQIVAAPDGPGALRPGSQVVLGLGHA